jgi:mycothiol S-conjugate amidase
MCHTVSMAAFRTAADHEAHPHAGEPWQPLKIYYNQTMSKGRIVTFHDAMEAAGLESPYAEWIKRWEDRGERTITTRVECSAYFAQRDQALLAHATQVDPDGTWFTVPLDMQREIWPTEDYEAALSYVPITPIEDDLFAGLGSPEEATELATSTGLQIAFDGTGDES